ncbi:hypothetical protein [Chelativorans sp. AA-79]|uniref:DUF6894 family protein n=1 Tax=Chelativorans sp. AA-79 TaxID=3028735 RepID=UPI0023F91814|nr:hypothetical protein [Chelativorans sp. AA-79]WEX10584.1 hypothetical protein PVE73_06400 [Chelativorans sp. AA-79]
MPRYFFHVAGECARTAANSDIELPDPNAAWSEAITTCGEMIKDLDGTLPIGTDWKMEVADDDGPIFVISVRSARLR